MKKPSRWLHLVSAFVFLLFVVIVPLALLFQMVSLLREGLPLFTWDEFALPGEHVMKLQVPGEYTFRTLVSGTFENKPFSAPDGFPPGSTLRIRDQASGEEVKTSKVFETNFTSFNSTWSTVASFSISKPGLYSVTLEGTSEKRVAMVTYCLFDAVLLFALKTLASVIVGLALAPLVSIGIEIWRFIAKLQAVKTDASRAP